MGTIMLYICLIIWGIAFLFKGTAGGGNNDY